MVLDKEVYGSFFCKALSPQGKPWERRMIYEERFKKADKGEIESAGVY
jgi:nicotinamide riboside kinase